MTVYREVAFCGLVEIEGGYYILNSEVIIGLGLDRDRWNEASKNLFAFLLDQPVIFVCEGSYDVEKDPSLKLAFDTFKNKLAWTKSLIIALWQIRPSLAVDLLKNPSDLQDFLLRECPELRRHIHIFNRRVRELVLEYIRWVDRGNPQRARMAKVQNVLTWISPRISPLRVRPGELEQQLEEATDWAMTIFTYNVHDALESLSERQYLSLDGVPIVTSSLQSAIPDSEDRKWFAAVVDPITRMFPDKKFYLVCKDNKAYNKNGVFLEKIRQERTNLFILDLELFDKSFTLEELAIAKVALDAYSIVLAKDRNAMLADGNSIMTGGGLIEFECSNRGVVVRYTVTTNSALTGVIAKTLREHFQRRRYTLEELFKQLKK